MVLLQAHRGVSSEYPENTMCAIMGAFYQGYKIAEIDVEVTADGKFVLLHDKTINRTARNADLSEITEQIFISDITYNEALNYDFGCWFSNKFKGIKIPLLSEVLEFVKGKDIILKIDNKISFFTTQQLEELFKIIQASGVRVAIACFDVQFARYINKNLPDAEIHYDGYVTEGILKELRSFINRENLIVWVPFDTPINNLVQVEFANDKLCSLVKKYASLGLWTFTTDREYEYAIQKFSPDYIETNGIIKPKMREGVIADVHTHSEHSHDSACPIVEMASKEIEENVSIMAVTDHCDVEFSQDEDVSATIAGSVADAKRVNAITPDIEILTGGEIGEACWYLDVAQRVIEENDCDIIIGSVHWILLEDLNSPHANIDFGKLGVEGCKRYIDKYFDDIIRMLNETEMDVLAHLTVPLRYINCKYNLGLDCKIFKDKIEKILKFIIKHGIALEINTSCKGSAYDEFLPEEWIVKLYKDLGGYLVTLGSDAHVAENGGHGLREAIDMLKRLGFKNTFYLKNRYFHQCAIK